LTTSTRDETRRDRRRPILFALGPLVALAPAVAAVWAHEGFVTQDGPAHLYNAHVIAQSFDPASPFRDTFEVRRQPLPNWAGHLTLMTLLAVLSPRDADRAMTTLTLGTFAVSVAWLRWRVAGREGRLTASLLAAVLSLNLTWLLGFGSFLMGASVFPIALGVWWAGRDGGWSPRRASGLAVLTLLGYYCHLVSLGLTAVGLTVLETLTPARARQRLGRAATTALGLSPLVPFGLIYLGLMRRGGGGVVPEWKHLTDPLSPREWARQLTWVDPISLARKDYLPLVGTVARWHLALAPVLWVGAALAVGLGSCRQSGRGRLGWWVLGALLLVAGAAGPDSRGPSHGGYLQLRVVLLGVVALVPVLGFDWGGRVSRVATVGLLLVALSVQTAVVWDYAARSESTAGVILRAAPAVGYGRRIATRLTMARHPFRANPLLHADGALGVGTGNVVWSDYEARFYYFPVGFRPGLDRPDPAGLEWVALHDEPAEAAERTRRWASLLERHHDAIDVVLTWGDDPALDAANARWYRPVEVGAPVRVWVRPDD
jgi:hypothetical protein